MENPFGVRCRRKGPDLLRRAQKPSPATDQPALEPVIYRPNGMSMDARQPALLPVINQLGRFTLYDESH